MTSARRVARIHFVAGEADKIRYEAEARREGVSLGGWFRAAAEERIRAGRERRFASAAEFDAFVAECQESAGPGREPDWEDLKRLLRHSKFSGLRDPDAD